MKTSKRISLFLVIGIIGAGVGCSEQEPLVPITGRVFFNDKPLEFGAVMMQPPNGFPSTGIIQSDGTFEMTTHGLGAGSRLGVNKIRVTCFEGQRPSDKEDEDLEKPVGRSYIPRRYNSYANGLTVEIKPDTNEPLEIRLTDN